MQGKMTKKSKLQDFNFHLGMERVFLERSETYLKMKKKVKGIDFRRSKFDSFPGLSVLLFLYSFDREGISKSREALRFVSLHSVFLPLLVVLKIIWFKNVYYKIDSLLRLWGALRMRK